MWGVGIEEVDKSVDICIRIVEVCVSMVKKSERASLCYIHILDCFRFQNCENF